DAGVEVEVVEPHQRKPDHGEADVRTAGRRSLAVDVVDKDQGTGRGREPQHQPRFGNRVVRAEELQDAANELKADDASDRGIDELQAMLALVVRGGQAVEEADPDEIAGALGEAEHSVSRGDRTDPCPAGGQCECGSEQPLAWPPRRLSEAPDCERSEAGRRERMAPEGDQRVHPPSTVKSTDSEG